MADVSVVAHRSGFSAKDPWGWEHGETVARPEVRTDAEGRFTLRNVAKEGVAILVHGEAILFAKVRLGEETDVDDVRIVVNRRMHLQVELDPPVDRADEVRVLDGKGQPMDVVIMRGESSFVFPKAEVVDGRSQVLSLSRTRRRRCCTRRASRLRGSPSPCARARSPACARDHQIRCMNRNTRSCITRTT
jgi:hypothetical protein